MRTVREQQSRPDTGRRPVRAERRPKRPRAALRGMLGDVLAGLMLMFVRPYAAGERVRIYLPDARTDVDGELVHVGPLQTTLCSSAGLIAVPNRRMLRAAPRR